MSIGAKDYGLIGYMRLCFFCLEITLCNELTETACGIMITQEFSEMKPSQILIHFN